MHGVVGLFEVGDERGFERVGLAAVAQGLGRAHGQHGAAVHQRDAVAALGLVHEVRRDEDGDVVVARELAQLAPEQVARGGVHARGGLVEDQHLGPVQAGGGELQALADAQRELVRRGLGVLDEVEALQPLLDGLRGGRAFELVELGVQLQVLPHAELFVERERLRHIAHAHAGGQVAGVDGLAQQLRAAGRDVEQTGEHLHRRRLAAAVAAQEAEDLAALDAKADVVHRHEVAEAARQVLGFDGGRAVGVRARRDHQRLAAAALVGRQQGHVGGLQRGGAGGLQHGGGGVAGQHAAVVHRHQMVEALGFFHVGRGHDHRHAGALGAQGFDQAPELPARERVHAGGGLVEDQQVGVVDQRAAQPELLLHAARELAGGAVAKRCQAGGVEQALDTRLALGRALAEQPREEIDVLAHRQRGVEVAPQPLRHEGDARGQLLAKARVGHVAAQHAHAAALDGLDAGDDGQQGRFADAVRPDQADGAPGRQLQRDVRQRGARAVVGVAVREIVDLDGVHGAGAVCVGIGVGVCCGVWGGSFTASSAGQAAFGSMRTKPLPVSPAFT